VTVEGLAMSRTRKRQIVEKCMRNPRGAVRAKRETEEVAPVRKKAVPPDSYDDIQPEKQCFLAYRLMHTLLEKKHMSLSKALTKVKAKCKLQAWQAALLRRDIIKHWNRRTIPT
jgi:hypothetical protein